MDCYVLTSQSSVLEVNKIGQSELSGPEANMSITFAKLAYPQRGWPFLSCPLELAPGLSEFCHAQTLSRSIASEPELSQVVC